MIEENIYQLKIQTHKCIKGTLIQYDNTKRANVQGKPLLRSHKITAKTAVNQTIVVIWLQLGCSE